MCSDSLPVAKQNGHPYFAVNCPFVLEDGFPLAIVTADLLLVGAPNQNNDPELRGVTTSLCRRTMLPLRVSLLPFLWLVALNLASPVELDPRLTLDWA